MELEQMDFETAFINPDIDCPKGSDKQFDIWMEMPEGYQQYDEHGNKLYCKLNKSLYGLKQASRNWNSMIHDYLTKEKFTRSYADPCLYHNSETGIHLALYVDDLIIAGKNKKAVSEFKAKISDVNRGGFVMTDLGELDWFLGMEKKRDRENKQLR